MLRRDGMSPVLQGTEKMNVGTASAKQGGLNWIKYREHGIGSSWIIIASSSGEMGFVNGLDKRQG